MYNGYLNVIYDDVQKSKIFLNELVKERVDPNYCVEEVKLKRRPKVKINPLPKKNKNYNLSYYHVLKDMALKKNIPASKLIDELIKEEYYKSNDKSILYKILDEQKIIFLILKDQLGDSKATSISNSYKKKKFRKDL